MWINYPHLYDLHQCAKLSGIEHITPKCSRVNALSLYNLTKGVPGPLVVQFHEIRIVFCVYGSQTHENLTISFECWSLRDEPLMILVGLGQRIRYEFFFLVNRLMSFFPTQPAGQFFFSGNVLVSLFS